MTAAKKEDTKYREIILKAAHDALDKASGEIKNAAVLMAAEAHKNPVLAQAIQATWIDRACYEEVRKMVGKNRGARENLRNARRRTSERSPFGGNDKTGIIAMAQSNARDLMNFELWGGKRLGDATGQEVRQSANNFYAQSFNMSMKGRWLALVAQKVPEDKIVGKTLTSEDLETLRLEAERGENE